MTPEERFRSIENALSAMAEHRAEDDARIRRLDEQMEKTTEGIRDLIVVSRTLVDSQQHTENRMDALIDTVDRMGGKIGKLSDTVDKLSDTVDRFVKGLEGGGNGHHS